MKLSIVMMIKNEAKYLDKCLMSIKPIQAAIEAEIIIVDTGSEDNSVEIAKKYTDKVYFHKWNNDFAAMRNITISYAEGEWILVLDGDEVIEDSSELIDFFKSGKNKKYNTGILRLKNFTLDDIKYSQAYIPRLFKRDKDFKYSGVIHEQPNIKEPFYYFNFFLLHYGYISNDMELMERKFIRNTEILKNELRKDPEKIYYWFQLAQSYAAHGDYDDALEADLRAYELAKKTHNLRNIMNVYIHMAIIYDVTQRYQELEQICSEALQVKDGYIDVYYYLAKAQSKLNKNTDAIGNYQIYLDMAGHYEDFAGAKDISVTTATLDLEEEVYAGLCILCCKEKLYEKTLKYKEKLKAEHLIRVALPHIVKAYVSLNMAAALKSFYDTVILMKYEKLSNDFINILEAELPSINKQGKNALMDAFAQGESIYSILNLVRKGEQLSEAHIESLQNKDFNKLPAYFSEIIYYLLKRDCLSSDILKHLNDTTLTSYFVHLIRQYKKECKEYVLSYIRNTAADGSLADVRIRKALGKVLLLLNILSEEEYKEVFEQYIGDGMSYLYQVYNQIVIAEELICDVKNEEEAMLLYMCRAEEVKKSNRVMYVRYLQKSIEQYPAMAEGIKLYMNRLEDELKKQKEDMKENIKAVIQTGNLLRAHKLIYEYEKMDKHDVQILSMKAVIAIMENHLEDAEAIINEGLAIEDKNFDLLYNLKYVYEGQGKTAEAEAVQVRIAYSLPTKRYIDLGISSADFFKYINDEDIRYVVMEYNEKLPYAGKSESISLLVDNDDLVKVSKYFIPCYTDGAQLCEVYSVKAVPGSTDAALPGYSQEVSENILKNRVLHNGMIYTACEQDFNTYIANKTEADNF